MIYLTSITVLVSLLLLLTVVGRRITDFLPTLLRESVGFYVSPLLGLVCVVLITTVYGWISPFKTEISIPLYIGLFLIGIAFEKQRTEFLRTWVIISAFVIVVTIPVLAPAIRFNSFNSFNA